MNEYDHDMSPGKLTVRDILAINRTVLANERTFLAYLRTSATFLIAGISLVKFFESILSQVGGFAFIISSFVIGFYGLIKYDSMRKLILKEKNVRHAKDINNEHDMMYVPKIMWERMQNLYARLTLRDK
jgi:putative membrane protein